MDRFLKARHQFRMVVQQFENLRQAELLNDGERQVLEPEVLAKLLTVKTEFVSLFGLYMCDPSMSIPDMSHIGESEQYKWYTCGGKIPCLDEGS